MTVGSNQRGKRPINPAAGAYGHPIHPILVTVPIGAWVASLVFDVVSRVAATPGTFAVGALWLIGIGIIGALAAAGFGLMDLVGVPHGTRAFRTGLLHAGLNVTVVLAFTASFFLRRELPSTAAVPIGLIGLSVVSLAWLGVSGFLGGKLAYRYGVRVADETTQAEGFAHRVESTPTHGLREHA